jgi:hypothetical protein
LDGTVIKVVDGDSIVVQVQGRPKTVRVIVGSVWM